MPLWLDCGLMGRGQHTPGRFCVISNSLKNPKIPRSRFLFGVGANAALSKDSFLKFSFLSIIFSVYAHGELLLQNLTPGYKEPLEKKTNFRWLVIFCKIFNLAPFWWYFVLIIIQSSVSSELVCGWITSHPSKLVYNHNHLFQIQENFFNEI